MIRLDERSVCEGCGAHTQGLAECPKCKQPTRLHLPAEMAERFNMPRSQARRLIAQGRVTVNGKECTELDIPGGSEPHIALVRDLDEEIADLLTRMEALSNAATQAWNKSGGHSGEPDDGFVALVANPHRETPMHLLWRRRFSEALGDTSRRELLVQARGEYAAFVRRQSPAEGSMTDREIRDARILELHGWSPIDVAREVCCGERDVRKVRIAASREPEFGEPLHDLSDSPTTDQRERAREYIERGLTERQVVSLTGLKKTTIRRICGRAA